MNSSDWRDELLARLEASRREFEEVKARADAELAEAEAEAAAQGIYPWPLCEYVEQARARRRGRIRRFIHGFFAPALRQMPW